LSADINLAIVGLGYWGPNLVRVLYQNQLCRNIYCFDIDGSKLKRIKSRYPTLVVANSYQELINDEAIDGVLIATPISTHYKLAREALLRGKHVFIEKPMSSSSSQAEELFRLAQEKNRVLMVGHTFLFSPPVIKIKEIIDSKELGEVYYISSSRVNLGIHQRDVSVIWDLAPHDFSIIYYWLKESPIRVSAFGRAYVQRGIPDVAFINMEFESGCIAHFQVSWLAPSKLRRTMLIGSKKMLVYDDTEILEKVKVFDKGVNYKDPESFGEYHLSYRSGDIVSPKLDTYEPLQRELSHFVSCLQSGETPDSDGRTGIEVVKMLEMAEKSLVNNGKLMENKNEIRA